MLIFWRQRLEQYSQLIEDFLGLCIIGANYERGKLIIYPPVIGIIEEGVGPIPRPSTPCEVLGK